MLNLETTTKLSADDAKAKVKKFFGEGGYGLKLTDEGGDCLSFEGAGGYVTATQEWEFQVKQFAGDLK